MSFLLGILLVAKGLALVGGLFVISSGSGNVVIAPPRIVQSDSVLLITTQVNEPLSPEIRELLKTGLGIPLELSVDFYEMPEAGALNSTAATRIFGMDLVNENYFVVRDSAAADTVWNQTLKEGLAAHGQFKDMLLAHRSQIQKEKQYQIVLTARLKKVNMGALGGKEVDLMKFWDYKEAQLKTEPFYGKELIQ
jgi:hypothetical protein